MNRSGHNDKGHEHVTETPDVSHIKNLDVTHEASDVSVSGILKFVVALTVFAIAVHLLMWGLFKVLNKQEEQKEPKAGPMAMTEQERRPPDPKLQAAPGFGVKLENGQWISLENREPEAEYGILREQWERQLNCSSPQETSAIEQKLCLPIEDAMNKVLEGKSLPSRTKENSEETPSGRAEDYGIALPTAASSGRTTGKEKP